MAPPPHPHHLSYRPDVDGLRAVAVLAVVGFHAFPGWVRGGFVGVDVFFVISGYLISTIIVGGLERGNFSFGDFYARRIRRIFPALLLVLGTCLAAGWVFLLEDEFKALGKHTAGGAGFMANFMLWSDAGYFDTQAETKPLLHLWSLGIEEQFYMLWPLMLYFARQQKEHLFGLMAALALASLLASVYQTHGDAAGAFYSPLTRFWELVLGALLAHARLHPGGAWAAIQDKWLTFVGLSAAAFQTVKAWLGVALLGAAFLTITKETAFPGAWALLPTVGAALIISAGPNTWVNQKVLSCRPLVWVGLISYPLYLWHWPLLSMEYIVRLGKPGVGLRLGAVLASVALAYFTYRTVEQPARGGRGLTVAVLVALMVGVGLTGYQMYAWEGVGSRAMVALNPTARSLVVGEGKDLVEEECGVTGESKKALESCFQDKREPARYAVWGDSKGHALFWGLVRNSTEHHRWLLLGNMTPVVSDAPVYQRYAQANAVALKALVENPRVQGVVLVAALRGLFRLVHEDTVEELDASPYFQEALTGLGQAVSLLEAAHKTVVLVVDNPTFPDPKKCMTGRLTGLPWLNGMLGHQTNPRCTLNFDEHLRRTQKYHQLLIALQEAHPHLKVYDPTPLLCEMDQRVCHVMVNGESLYGYTDHISDVSSTRIAKDFLPRVQQWAGAPP